MTVPYRTSPVFLKIQNDPKFPELEIPDIKKNIRVSTRAVRDGILSEIDRIAPYKEEAD